MTRKKKKLALFFDRKKSPLDKQDWNGQLFRVLSERSPSKRPDPLGYRLDLVGKSFSVRRGAKNGFDRFDLLEREKDKPLFVNEKKVGFLIKLRRTLPVECASPKKKEGYFIT